MVKRELSVAAAEGYAFRPDLAEDTKQSLTPFAVVTAGGLSLSALVLWICFPPPSPATLSWPGLALFAAIYMAAAVAIHLVGLGLLYWLVGDQLELPIRDIARRSWVAAVWMPLWTLSGHQHSPWVAGVALVVAVQTTLCLRYLAGEGRSQADAAAVRESSLFAAEYGQGVGGRVQPAFLTAIAFQCGLGLLLLGQYLFSGLWFAGAIVYPVWKLSGRRPERFGAAEETRKALRWAAKLILPVVLTACALVPYAKNLAVAGAFARWLGFRLSVERPVVKEQPLHHGSSFSGIILVPLAKPVKHLVAPLPETAAMAAGKMKNKPVDIEFDGVYWYFEPADERPLADAPVVRGDAIRNTIHSTHDAPVAMVANQSLNPAISMRCCRSMRVEILSREDALGPILLEVVLRDGRGKTGVGTVSLGNVLVPSSAGQRGGMAATPTDETLTFPFPKSAELDRFDGITVAIKPLNEQAARGAHIAIQRFTLVP